MQRVPHLPLSISHSPPKPIDDEDARRKWQGRGPENGEIGRDHDLPTLGIEIEKLTSTDTLHSLAFFELLAKQYVRRQWLLVKITWSLWQFLSSIDCPLSSDGYQID